MIDEFTKEPGKNLLALHVYFEKKRMFRHFSESLGRNLSVQKYLESGNILRNEQTEKQEHTQS